MGLGIVPSYKLVVTGSTGTQDITAIVQDRFCSLTLTEETGGISDTLDVELADHAPTAPIAIPPSGAVIALSLGYDGAVTAMGKFVVDEVELSGWPGKMTFRCRAAPYTQATTGYKDLQEQKTRSWKKGTTLGSMVQKMAGEHGMQSAVTPSLASIALPQTDQTDESDMNVLLRLAKRYDAVAKPAGGSLIFAARGTGQSSSGQSLPTIAVTPDMVSDYRFNQHVRDAPGTVIAYYHNVKGAAWHEVRVGSGDPVKRLKSRSPDAATATAAAKAALMQLARNKNSLSITMPGDPAFTAECLLTLSGFRDGLNRNWLVDKITHTLGDGGYTCSIECSLPNSDPQVAPYVSPDIADDTISAPSFVGE